MRCLPILMYHSIDSSESVVSVAPALFADQVQWLVRSGWRSVALREACAHRRDHGEWPSKTVVLTFDDAYANVSAVALPELQKHRFSATIFVVTGHVGRSNDWAPPPARLGRRPIMDWAQVEQAHRAGVEIAAHTNAHPNLTGLPSEQLDDELRSSQTILEQRLGQAVESFAYPFGNYDEAVEAKARQYFTNVCTTSLSRAGHQPDHALPRVDMYYVQSLAAFKRLVMGKMDSYLAVRRWGRTLKHMVSHSAQTVV